MEIVIASISVFSSVLTASLAYIFSKRMQRSNEKIQMKIEAYKNYIDALANLAQNHRDKKLCQNYAVASNFTVLVASSTAITAIMEFNQYIQSTDKPYSVLRQDQLIEKIYRELRTDLHLYKKPNENLNGIKLFVGGGHL